MSNVEDFDLKHIFQVAAQILLKKKDDLVGLHGVGRSSNGYFTGVMDQYGSVISDVARQMTCNLSESDDEKMEKILKGVLSNYSWKAKLVIAVAALASVCGKHVVVPSSESPMILRSSSETNPMMFLRRLDIVSDREDPPEPLKKWLSKLDNLVQLVVGEIRQILFNQDQEIAKETQLIIAALIVKVAVVCSSQITVSHLLLLSHRERVFETYEQKLDDLSNKLR